MASVTHDYTYVPSTPRTAGPTGKSLFKRIVAAMMASREAQARREIARHVALFGKGPALSSKNADVKRDELPF